MQGDSHQQNEIVAMVKQYAGRDALAPGIEEVERSPEMTWTWMTYANSFGHMVPSDLVNAVSADMDRQKPPGVPAYTKDIKDMPTDDRRLFIDQPGMIVMGRPIEVFQFLDLEISIPSEDLGDLVDHWTKANVVTAKSKAFYRFRSNRRCLVVDASQRDELLNLLRSRIATAEKSAAAFYATRLTAQESLRRLHPSMGVMLEYGPDRLGRFRYS